MLVRETPSRQGRHERYVGIDERCLNARFTGAGTGMAMAGGKETVGFQASTTIKRSDFGMGGFVPFVSDAVPLNITAAFEKTG